MKRRTCLLRAATLTLGSGLMAKQALAEETTLRFAWWGGGARHEATLKAIAAFEQVTPGLKIKAEYMGFNGYLERLTTQIAGRSEPDVMQINWAWLAMFSKRGNGFTDLNLYKSLLSLDQFASEDLELGMVAGKLNALPVGFTARILLWNKAAFDRIGLPLPKTWDDLFASGRVFEQKLGAKAYPLDGELYDMLLLAQAYVHQKFGTPFIDALKVQVAMSPAAALEWVRTYRRLIDGHVATPLPLRASLGGAEKPTEQQPDWVVGNWAGNYTWDSSISLRNSTLNRDQRLELGDFPTLPGAKNSGMFGRPSLMLAVGRNTKKPELAARFVNYLLTDPQAARIFGRTRGVPAAQSQYQALLGEKKLTLLEQNAFQQIKTQKTAGNIERPSPLFEHPRMQRFMREVFETVAYGKTSDQDAAVRLIDEGNALLRRIK